ncbi:MAG: orotate phosphoribosyltransferase [Saprospiraceae bacterium]|nr:orotate phosphoribosyltransferase [Saprospiraceae bacterium]
MINRAIPIAEMLLQINAIKLSPQNPFTWASGIKSPIYCDNRIVLSHPDVRNFVAESFIEASKDFAPFNVIAGVATAGVPHGAILAYKMNLPFIYVRDKSKSHGRQNQIEGELPENSRVLVIEDLISTGKSSLAAIEPLREAGAAIAGVLAIFTYQLPVAEQAFKEASVDFRTLSDYTTLLDIAIKSKYITEAEKGLLSAWRKDPENWQGY